MQFDLRKFIATGRQPYHAEFQCDLSAHDYAGARIPQPVTAVFEAETDGDEVRMTLRANASVHGECARCLDPVVREETVDTEWTVKERDLDDPDFQQIAYEVARCHHEKYNGKGYPDGLCGENIRLHA